MSRKVEYIDVKKIIEVEKDGNCLLLSKEYKNRHAKLQLRCVCTEKFERTLASIQKSNKLMCNSCLKVNLSKHKTKSHTDYVKDVYELDINKEFEIVGKYINQNNKVEVKHLSCGRVWFANPASFLTALKRNGGCYDCSLTTTGLKKRKTNEDFVKEVYGLVGDEYIFIDEYKKASDPIRVWHKKCNEIFKTTANRFLNGSGCNKCANKQTGFNQRKSDGEFKQEVYSLVGDEYTFTEEYQTNRTKIKIKHNSCNTSYFVKPSSFLNGTRCPICTGSKSERKVAKILRERDINFEKEKEYDDLKINRCLRYDFYIQDKIILELDGELHFKPARFSKNKDAMQQRLENIQKNDVLKNEYCTENNIPLIRISYREDKNLEYIITSILIYYGFIENVSLINYNKEEVEGRIINKDWNHDKYLASVLKGNQ